MTKPLFNKVLIANRGEIALRIIRTLKKMGIISVAVYSEADATSLHVQEADEAYFIGNSPATESYLSISNILNAIEASGADAVHPGYGFLSENAKFARALDAAGVVLIGPSADAIEQMGDKVIAKKIAIEAGVNTVPGYLGIIQKPSDAISIAEKIGLPVIIKAAAGGGGRGMRAVYSQDSIETAVKSAALEASSNFSDGRVFIEKLIEHPRHIEIQVLADKYGNVICVGERECSIQRYHQKVIEESPSTFVDDEMRTAMYAQATLLAKAVGYFSAGTVEFIVDKDRQFYFLEMNTRLQVEHPVTELVTGIDLVEEMINIAAGKELRYQQKDIELKGWAIECRICSEDPARGFLPSSGRIVEYTPPLKSPNIRIDSGVNAGSEVSMFYDAMIAKLCSYGNNREEAIEAMRAALSGFMIRGVAHNISFLEAIINHPKFIAGNINTNFIANEYPDGFSGAMLTSQITEVFVATAVHIFLTEQTRWAKLPDQLESQDGKLSTRWVVNIDDKSFPILAKQVGDGYNIRHQTSRMYVRSHWALGSKLFNGTVNGEKVTVKIEFIPTGYLLTYAGISVKAYVRSNRVAELEAYLPESNSANNSTDILSPLCGLITDIKINEGDEVQIGQELVILTAMKMENIIIAERSGIVAKIHVKAGEQVDTDQLLLEYK